MTPDHPPVSSRVPGLVSEMTDAEKVGQLFGVWLDADATEGVAPMQHEHARTPADWDELITSGIGQLTRPYGTAPIDPLVRAKWLADLQRRIVEANRFGIPALVHEETLTGLAAWQAPVFPAPLCWGASFDPALVEQMAAHIGATMRRLGVHQGLAPVLDVTRDLRWGRTEETIGEDPLLVGTIGAAYVRGLQSAGVVATLKHFAGYSAGRAGRNLAPVSIGPRELADIVVVPFEHALRAGADSVMNAYSDVDGMPAAADESLLTTLLRDRLGFTGTVVADYFAVTFLRTLHAVAADDADAAGLALAAGIDVELPAMACYGPPLIEAVENGRVPVGLLDRALVRVLAQKERLGLLDPQWTPEPPVLTEPGPSELDDDTSRALALRLAQRSIVLLRNENAVLPLRPGARLAVVGPNADTANAMLGCYSFPRHVGVHHPDVAVGVDIPTLLDALTADPAGYRIFHAAGGTVTAATDEDIALAVEAAAGADVCLAVLGDSAGLFGTGTSGEGNDVADLRLPGRQEDLLEALADTGTPVVAVLLSGRPYDLSRQVDRLAGVVCAFFAGEQGAPALADVLSGRHDAVGRLPVGFPAAKSSQPAGYLGAALARRSEVSEIDPTPLFPFGFGLSYANAQWVSVTADSAEWATDGAAEVVVSLRNDSARAVSEVVQVYLHDPVAQVARPVQQLVAAPRVDLEPGTSCTVHLVIHADQTSYTAHDLRRIVEPGEVQLWVGRSSTDIDTVLQLTMSGPVREAGPERVLTPRVTVQH